MECWQQKVFGWEGRVLKFPRTQLSDALRRPEAPYTGVYLLFGENEAGPILYVGEAENVSDRIRNHDSKKDWWGTAIIITSAANDLNKAHVKYLEARLIEVARDIGKIPLDNGRGSARSNLSEADIANMEAFLDHIFLVLPAVRIDCFLRDTRPVGAAAGSTALANVAPVFELRTVKHGIQATAKLENGEFVVQAGSLARRDWEGQGSENTSYGQLHAELVRTGVLVDNEHHRVFRENYAFKSPSAAAAVVNGRPSNGTVEWKVKGQAFTYKQWEAEQLKSDRALRSTT
jgi:hypothetical protein